MAILANFENEEPISAITQILQEVKVSATGGFAESRYFNQLRALVQLRNFGNQLNKAMEFKVAVDFVKKSRKKLKSRKIKL